MKSIVAKYSNIYRIKQQMTNSTSPSCLCSFIQESKTRQFNPSENSNANTTFLAKISTVAPNPAAVWELAHVAMAGSWLGGATVDILAKK